MSFLHWLQDLRSALAQGRGHRRIPRRAAVHRPRLEVLEDRTLLSTYTVGSLTDTGAGSGLSGDLRYCLTHATSGNDTITFAQGLTGAIKLESTLALNTSVAIQGPGASLLTVEPKDAPGNFNIFGPFFAVGSTARVEISGLTISGKNEITGDLGNGGIANNGTLTVSACIFSDNRNLYGGAISNYGTAIVSNSTFNGNTSAVGGAIFNSGVLTLNSGTIEANYLNAGYVNVGPFGDANGRGGAIFNQGVLTINNSTLAHNSAQGGNAPSDGLLGDGMGGGIFMSAGTLSINSSTLSDNRAHGGDVSDDSSSPGNGRGGGLFIAGGTVSINNSTIADNQAIPGLLYSAYTTATYSYGGGIQNAAGPGALQMDDTILADNVAYSGAPDLAGSVTSLGHNLIGNSTGGSGFVASDLVNVNPQLGPLQNNGGPTQTRALLAGSPAIDAGDNANAPAYDQRGPGFARLVNGAIDIGAFEVQTNAPQLQIRGVTVTEGNTGSVAAQFTVTLSAASTQTITVAYATANGTATAGSDYQATSGTLTFAPGQTSKTVTVLVNGDTSNEPDETFNVILSGATNATLGTAIATGTIQNDDGVPSLAITDVASKEGNSGTTPFVFTVTLSATSIQPITVAYATADGTATAGSDYQAASGTLTFAPGETSKTISVLVKGDRLPEPNETFFVNLSNPNNATIADGQGVGTIVDDEPRISISDVSKKEGKKGHTTQFTFTVTLSAAYDQAVTMSYSTVNGAAKAGTDYRAKTGTLTFSPGETTKTITIEIIGNNKKEADKTFYLDLFGNSGNSLFTKNRGIGTILNDDSSLWLPWRR